MKRMIFYILLIVQIGVIAIIGWQNQLIDRYGKEIQLRAAQEYSGEYGWIDYRNHLNVVTEIDRISSKLWEVDTESLSFNDRVYVLLEEDEKGYHIVKKASTKRFKPEDHQIVLSGSYVNHQKQGHKIDYQWEKVPREEHEHINHLRPYFVTVKVAPWGQWKITKLTQE